MRNWWMRSESIIPDRYFLFFTPIMPLTIASINSGSNGNCYYIGNQSEAVLIDAGISCRETERRLSRMGLSFEKIKAIFISHEHTDHTYGAEVIARRYGLPVFVSDETYRNSRMNLEGIPVKQLHANAPVTVGELVVDAFPKLHDAVDPHSFTVTDNGITVGIFTDIGSPCEHLVHHFSRCHAAFLEANYDEVMLKEGRYPHFLKNRISSDHGHLSNDQALELFLNHKAPFMSHLLLSHLSKDNNDPRLVLDLFRKQANGTHVSIASRWEESAVYCVDGSFHSEGNYRAPVQGVSPIQLTFF